MNQVESVAFWCSFIGTIVGIVLSIVAIVFSILVDRRSSQVSEHTIQSLQKIESVVERLSSDTRELIKAAWDKMLGGVDQAPESDLTKSSAKQVAAGIAAELRSELVALNENKGQQGGSSDEKIQELEKYLKELEASLMAQLSKAKADSRPSQRFEEVLNSLRALSDRSRTLLRAVSRKHLTQRQYRLLSSTALGSPLFELRQAGLIVPVVHSTDKGELPCYFMPPGMATTARAALELLPDPSAALETEVYEVLSDIGYVPLPHRSRKKDSTEDHPDSSGTPN